MGRSILLISHFYPPSDMVAARRPAALAKYLSALGHRVTVLTSGAWGERPAAEEPAAAVVRTGDLMTSRLNWRRDQLRAWTGESNVGHYREGASWPARVLVPDVAVLTWLPYLLPAAMKLVMRARFDCAITTSGPESVHLVGLALRERGVAWIADLRDGWRFETLHSWPTRMQDTLDAKLERLAMTRAHGVSAVTEPIAADLRERLGIEAWTITNGYDPEEVPSAGDAHALLDGRRHSMLYTGRMASSQRSPQPVLDALRRLRKSDPGGAARFELALAGPLTPEERRMVDAPDLRGHVRALGNLPRGKALELQSAADSLLLLTAGNRRGEATGKLYEYLAAARPILVLGDRTEAARIMHETGAGLAVPADDVGAVADALRRLVHGELPEGGGASRERYAYPALAQEMAELVAFACERRARAQRKRRE